MQPYQAGYPNQQPNNWNNSNHNGFAYYSLGNGSYQPGQQQQQFNLPWMQPQAPQQQLNALHQQHYTLQQQIQKQSQDLQQQNAHLQKQMEQATSEVMRAQLQTKQVQLQSQQQTLSKQLLEQQQLLQQLPPSANFQYTVNYEQSAQYNQQLAVQQQAVQHQPSPKPSPSLPHAKPIPDIHVTKQQQNSPSAPNHAPFSNPNAKPAPSAAPTFTSFAITAPTNTPQQQPMLNASLFNASKKKKTTVISSPPSGNPNATTVYNAMNALNSNNNNNSPSSATMTPNKARKRLISASPPAMEGLMDEEPVAIPTHAHQSYGRLDTFNNNVTKKSKFSATNPSAPPTPPPSGPSPASGNYPSALHQYILKAYEQCRTSPAQMDIVEKKLKDLLTKHEAAKTIWSTNWATYPLPTGVPESSDMEMDGPPVVQKSINFAFSTTKKSPAKIPQHSAWSMETETPEEQSPQAKPLSKKEKKKLLQQKQRALVNAAGSAGKKKKDNAFTLVSDDTKLEGRARRFVDTTGDSGNYGALPGDRNSYSSKKPHRNYDPFSDEPINYTCVGTCEVLEKRYLRLTADPEPSLVRPERILVQSLAMVKQKWQTKAKDWEWTCDQLKAIRQDLRVQNIRNQFTVNVYEIHARLCIENKDIVEFNQCQNLLLGTDGLYQENATSSAHVMEFTAYRVLLSLYQANAATQSKILSEIPANDKKNPTIKHALDTIKSVQQNNFAAFFRLYAAAPNMGRYVLDFVRDKVRVSALKTITTAFRPTVSVEYISKVLGFNTKFECIAFLKERLFVSNNNFEDIDCKVSYGELLNWEKAEEAKLLKQNPITI